MGRRARLVVLVRFRVPVGGLENALPPVLRVGFLNVLTACRCSAAVWLATGSGIRLSSGFRTPLPRAPSRRPRPCGRRAFPGPAGSGLAVRRALRNLPECRPLSGESSIRREYVACGSGGSGMTRTCGKGTRRSGVHLIRLGVELAVPLAELHDRAIGVGERGRRQEGLVLPDRTVFLHLLVDLTDERIRNR
jgi:hypothetical protein